jgi:large subunit ribosomal protein L11e
MDFFVVLDRPGYRISRRKKMKKKVGVQHKVTKKDAQAWFEKKFDGIILNK